MPRPLSLAVLLVCAAAILSACQLAGAKGPSAADEAVTPNAVTGDPIEVKALDAPPTPAADVRAGTGEATAKPAAPAPAGSAQGFGGGAIGDATGGAAAAVTSAAAAPAPAEVPATVPETGPAVAAVPARSEAQLACEKKGGSWYKVGKGEKRACVRQTRDANKRCDRESQCEGVCLARSGTCSPFKPMYGCNEIFQDNGARVTLCLE